MAVDTRDKAVSVGVLGGVFKTMATDEWFAGGNSGLITPAERERLGKEVAYTTVTIAAADWAQGTCTKQVAGVTPSSVVRVGAEPASEIVASNAHVYCSAQGNGTLTFSCVDAPEAAVTLNVEVREA